MAGPSFRGVLATAGLIGAVPALVLLALLGGGHVAPGPGLAGLLACAAAAVFLARVWLGDLARLSEALRRTAPPWDDGRGEAMPAAEAPLLPAAREVHRAIARLGRDLAKRREAAALLRQADEAVVEELPDPLLVLSPARAPLRANAAARALFAGGDGAARLREGDAAALLRHPALVEAVDRALAERRPQVADLALPVPVPREWVAQVAPVDAPPAAGGVRVVVALSDRTRERAVERMRADFVANASHELRTPLASLVGFIETLRGPAEDDPAARARFLAIMAEQSERMRRLIDDLLGLSRIELAEHQPPLGRAPLAEIARAEAAALEPLLRARRMTLVQALDEGASTTAAPADADQLAQVVRNLLDNAVRHGREGGEVRLSVAPAEAGGRPGVSLTVADDGPGIPREHIPRLTERFYRVDRGRSRAAGGTGLGLAIVKHIVSRHRGQLSIESREGAGARFRVWLPASPPQG